MEKIYAVVIGADRISNNSDIEQIRSAGLLNNVTSIIDLQINMGANRTTEMQSSNVAFLGQYQKLAVREFASKGISKHICKPPRANAQNKGLQKSCLFSRTRSNNDFSYI